MTATAKRQAYLTEYNSRPASIAKRKARQQKHNSKPAVKAKSHARKKAAVATPEGRAKLTAYNNRTDVKAKRNAHNKQYINTLVGRLKSLITNARRNARKREHIISVDYKDLLELYDKQEGKCTLTGWEMTPVAHQLTTISLDRIDNSLGYSIDNIHLVTRQANWAKNQWTVEQLITFCNAIVENHNTKGNPHE